ncbi:putative protein S-acyltransferase 7-like [Hibiscus syriacus]|uniref:Protein kinase domain-containing protein n=1 Tax=Hibiscus syriacus TaxID=106335 RepID=A0A6A2ZZI3_HIBSY|nr:putative protein S-acyltransferase 7-like [Hibiscus syriacus]
MQQGSLEDHLHYLAPDEKPLDWNTRMKIASGDEFNPKLSDFGFAKFGPSGDKSHVSTRVMGTHGYCAPEYLTSGKLTTKSDLFFGVVLLELITGRRAFDDTRARDERLLVDWKALEVAVMCFEENENPRPSVSEIVIALDYFNSHPYNSDEAKRDSVKGPGNSDSPNETTRMLGVDYERERAVAEAKMWGELERKKGSVEKCLRDDQTECLHIQLKQDSL